MMSRSKIIATLIIALVSTVLFFPRSLKAADSTDPIEAAGIGVGLTAGNSIAIPAKAVSVLWGLTSGALSFILSGGNVDLTKQIWNDVTEGPYMITPEVARKAVGERPELQKKPASPEAAPGYTSPTQ